jgi:hypothetical protein
MNMDEEIDDLIGLVKFDYEHTLSFIDGVVRVSTGIRTIAMAGCLALLAAAMQTEEAFLAWFGLVAALALGIQDAYHGWLYAEARKRVDSMEKLLRDYYKLQSRTSGTAARQLLKRLRKHRIGQRTSLANPLPPRSHSVGVEWRQKPGILRRVATRLRLVSLWRGTRTVATGARPQVVYGLLYPLLAAATIAVAIILTGSDGASPTPVTTRLCVACGTEVHLDRPRPGQSRVDRP